MIIRQLVRVRFIAVRDANALVGQIDVLHIALEEVGTVQQFADGIDNVRDVQVARGHFVEHRREQKKIFTIDQRDVHIRRMGELFFQVHGGIYAAEPTPKNDNLRPSVGTHITPLMSCVSGIPVCRIMPRLDQPPVAKPGYRVIPPSMYRLIPVT